MERLQSWTSGMRYLHLHLLLLLLLLHLLLLLAMTTVPVLEQTLLFGQNLSYQCNYTGSVGEKHICKGTDLLACQYILNTSEPTNSRYSLVDQKDDQTLIINITSLTFQDEGMYNCFTLRSDGKSIHNKLKLTVGESP
ncbi:hypothetical protein CRUP_016284 [Coryphaenoides rupestris]|nr:hypothetical protein CRUP_016284 [Coryphaenoides rupestris]